MKISTPKIGTSSKYLLTNKESDVDPFAQVEVKMYSFPQTNNQKLKERSILKKNLHNELSELLLAQVEAKMYSRSKKKYQKLPNTSKERSILKKYLLHELLERFSKNIKTNEDLEKNRNQMIVQLMELFTRSEQLKLDIKGLTRKREDIAKESNTKYDIILSNTKIIELLEIKCIENKYKCNENSEKFNGFDNIESQILNLLDDQKRLRYNSCNNLTNTYNDLKALQQETENLVQELAHLQKGFRDLQIFLGEAVHILIDSLRVLYSSEIDIAFRKTKRQHILQILLKLLVLGKQN